MCNVGCQAGITCDIYNRKLKFINICLNRQQTILIKKMLKIKAFQKTILDKVTNFQAIYQIKMRYKLISNRLAQIRRLLLVEKVNNQVISEQSYCISKISKIQLVQKLNCLKIKVSIVINTDYIYIIHK